MSETTKRPRRLSSLYYLPAEADTAIATAIHAAIVANTANQSSALEALNREIAPLGVPPIARSSWYRLLEQLLTAGVPSRWAVSRDRRETVTIEQARYIELLEAESQLLRLKASKTGV